MKRYTHVNKTATIFKVEWFNLRLSCKYLSGKTNPYRLYCHKWYIDEFHTYPTEHIKQIAAYGDLTSVMFYVYTLTNYGEYGYHSGNGEKAVFDTILKVTE